MLSDQDVGAFLMLPEPTVIFLIHMVYNIIPNEIVHIIM